MALPEIDDTGNMPPGLHRTNLHGVIERFGFGTAQRVRVSRTLRNIWERANQTGSIRRFIIFGSYVTEKPLPQDVDILLVMEDNFDMGAQSADVRKLFDHRATERYVGASLFWIRPSAMFMPEDDYLAFFQRTREGTLRGIVEVIS